MNRPSRPTAGYERLALFLDGPNLYGAARSLGIDIDYRKVLAWARAQGRLVRAFYYTAVAEDQEYSPLRPLVDWLDYNGFAVVTKPLKDYTDAQGRRRIKGNMDIELAIDMLEMAPHLDHAVLFSGDGDFRRLVEAVQRHGVRVTVIATMETQPPMIADELRRQADQFIDLADLGTEIQRDHPPGGAARDPRRRPAPGASAGANAGGPQRRPGADELPEGDDDDLDDWDEEDDADDYDDEDEDDNPRRAK